VGTRSLGVGFVVRAGRCYFEDYLPGAVYKYGYEVIKS
jgi:hypothetical protein